MATAFLVGFSGAAAPGPLTAVTIRETSTSGFRRGWSVVIGHAVPELLLGVALAYGAGHHLRDPRWVGTVAGAGGLALLWMALGIVREAKTASVPGRVQARAERGRNPVMSGLAATLSNPYWFIWWATVGAGYVALAKEQGWTGVALFFSGHIMADVVWLALVAAAVASGRRLMSDRGYRRLLLALGGFLGAFGLYFLWTAWRFWAGPEA